MGTQYTKTVKNASDIEEFASSSNETVNVTGMYISYFEIEEPYYNGTDWIHYLNVTREKTTMVGYLKYQQYTNVLGLVCFSVFFGIILSRMGKRGAVLVAFFASLNEVIMEMVMLIMWYSPFGICFLIIGKFLAITDLLLTIWQLGLYMLTVIIGLIIHSCVTLAGLFFICTRQNPAAFFKGMFQAWITAVGTASR